MANLPLIYRTVKGSPLTFSEGDENLRMLLSGSIEQVLYDSSSNSIQFIRYSNAPYSGTDFTTSINLSSGSAVKVDTTPQSNPTQGSLWWDPSDGTLYIYYQYVSNSVSAAAWVPAVSLAIEAAYAQTASLAYTASYVALQAGPGIIINYTGSNIEISSSAASTTVYYTGSIVTSSVANWNFTGSGVAVTQSGSGNVLVTIPGISNTVFTSSLLLSSSISKWNFTGSGVNVAQSGSDGVLVTILTGSSNTVFTSSLLLSSSISKWNFTGSGVTVAQSGSDGVLVTVLTGSSNNVFTSSALLSSSISNWNFTGSGVTVSQSGSNGVLITVAGGSGNLQSVTTAGGQTTASVIFGSGSVASPILASGENSFAQGSSTHASGAYSHAEGFETKAIGNYAHAEGYQTTAKGIASHADGNNTIAESNFQIVVGKYNGSDTDPVFIVGGGATSGTRRNILSAYDSNYTDPEGKQGARIKIQSGSLVLADYATMEYNSDNAAAAAGVPLGGIYRNGNFLLVRTGSAF